MRIFLLLVCSLSVGTILAAAIVFRPQPTPTILTTKHNFDIDEAPSQSLRGQIESLDWPVLWQNRTATQAAQIVYTQAIGQGESIETVRGSATVSFPGTLLELHPRTHVGIIQTLPKHLVFTQTQGTVNYYSDGAEVRSLHLLIQISSQVTVSVSKHIISVTGPVLVAYNDRNNISRIVASKKSLVFNDDTRRVVVK